MLSLQTTGMDKLVRPVLAATSFGGDNYGKNSLYAPTWFGKVMKIELP
ncbi:MAG: hypothetical protein R3332_03185 [Pseudohongiellaceae bacterium]|nr:hypothetical protein [Pseudohongiellaceae bacterium]